MAICGGCGAETSRCRTTFHAKKPGVIIVEECPVCKPEAFSAPFNPNDRIVTGPEAMPNLYTRGDDGIYRAKDELIADTVALIDDGPTSKAVAKKRSTRRTEPLTEAEIAESERWGREWLAPRLSQNPSV